jgi:FKBP-type peptidyl-prolyl cis-trans isomerase
MGCHFAVCVVLQVIKGFDQAVTGLAVGESRKERIAPENAVSDTLSDCVEASSALSNEECSE